MTAALLLLGGAAILLVQARAFTPFDPFGIASRTLAAGLIMVATLTAAVSFVNGPRTVADTYLRTDAAAAAAGCAGHRGVRELNPAGFASNGSAVCRDFTAVDLDEHREAPRPAAAIARDEASQQARREGLASWLSRLQLIAAVIAAAWLVLTWGFVALDVLRDRRGGGPSPSASGHGSAS